MGLVLHSLLPKSRRFKPMNRKANFHILVVEDDPVVRADIIDCLNVLGYVLISESGNSDKAKEILEYQLPDLIFLDIHLGKDDNGVELGHLINHEYRLPFIYLTAYSDDHTLASVKETLPAGYVLKPFHENMLKVAIEMALNTYYTVIKPHLSQLEDLNTELIDPLTRRELELLKLICKGLTNKELANQLFLSINTIKTHLKNLYLKLEVKNRAEAIVRVQEMV